jgi:hypothetical protein
MLTFIFCLKGDFLGGEENHEILRLQGGLRWFLHSRQVSRLLSHQALDCYESEHVSSMRIQICSGVLSRFQRGLSRSQSFGSYKQGLCA